MEQANDLLGYRLTDIMFEGTEEQLTETRYTQPAVFLHSLALVKVAGDSFQPVMVAGHSLGELSALVANGTLSFEDGLSLVQERALAMQEACDLTPSTMAAVIGLEDQVVEDVCSAIEDVVPANYNCPGQIAISGSVEGIDQACEKLKEAGARMTIKLKVAGAFHSKYMEPAAKRLEAAIGNVTFNQPHCQIYQNVTGTANTNPEIIKENLIKQLTAPVLWTQTVQNMITNGAEEFTETGPGKVLTGLIKKIDRSKSFGDILSTESY